MSWLWLLISAWLGERALAVWDNERVPLWARGPICLLLVAAGVVIFYAGFWRDIRTPEEIARDQAKAVQSAELAYRKEVANRGSPEQIAKKEFGDHEMRVDVRGSRVHLTVEWGDFLTAGWLKSQALSDIADFAVKTFETHANVMRAEIVIRAAMLDVYGRESREQVMRVVLSRTTVEKVNLRLFQRADLPKVADEYWEHPAFRAE